jgi:predicted O-methyltransferase YrrM
MFHEIPEPVLREMASLEARDAVDRADGTSRLERLRQIPPETGRFLALLAASAPEGAWLEIGTSAGYSALWLALACRERGRVLTTFEVLPSKVAMAAETFAAAGVCEVVKLLEGDFLEQSAAISEIAFCFLDAEKEVYGSCYDAVVPRLVPGGLLVADNAINHRATLQPMIDAALVDRRVDALVVPKAVRCSPVPPSRRTGTPSVSRLPEVSPDGNPQLIRGRRHLQPPSFQRAVAPTTGDSFGEVWS